MTPPLPIDAIRLADDIEAAAFADLYAAAPAPLAAQLGLAVEREGAATALLAPAVPSATFNRVIGVDLMAPDAARQVAHWVSLFDARGASVWWLHWQQAPAPDELPPVLQAAGFAWPARRRWAKMLRPANAGADAPGATLQVSPIADDEAIVVAQAIRAAFEMPPFMGDWLAALHRRPGWTVYAARDGSSIVGGACLYVQSDMAWLGMGSVLASHRRRGGQQALMMRRIADAARAGCRWVATETGEPVGDEPNPSLANMLRCGFVSVASRLNAEHRRAASAPAQ